EAGAKNRVTELSHRLIRHAEEIAIMAESGCCDQARSIRQNTVHENKAFPAWRAIRHPVRSVKGKVGHDRCMAACFDDLLLRQRFPDINPIEEAETAGKDRIVLPDGIDQI